MDEWRRRGWGREVAAPSHQNSIQNVFVVRLRQVGEVDVPDAQLSRAGQELVPDRV